MQQSCLSLLRAGITGVSHPRSVPQTKDEEIKPGALCLAQDSRDTFWLCAFFLIVGLIPLLAQHWLGVPNLLIALPPSFTCVGSCVCSQCCVSLDSCELFHRSACLSVVAHSTSGPNTAPSSPKGLLRLASEEGTAPLSSIIPLRPTTFPLVGFPHLS